jgi:hypothetical protein
MNAAKSAGLAVLFGSGVYALVERETGNEASSDTPKCTAIFRHRCNSPG